MDHYKEEQINAAISAIERNVETIAYLMTPARYGLYKHHLTLVMDVLGRAAKEGLSIEREE